MSKYRFKTREEFIQDGLWDEKHNCPDEWSWEGKMNKYLGMDVLDEFNSYCNKKEDFEYDGWHFSKNDYVLKEQQEYFDDLSQHIGRYIRALVDNPHSGFSVKKGDVGKIISYGEIDFPNHKAYNCTRALDKNNLGLKYELLPEDYSPEQEVKDSNVEFIPGKWYSFNWDWSGKDHIVVAKIKEVDKENFIISWRSYLWNDDDYNHEDGYFFKDISNIKELSIEEVQPYLPNGHPDKIINQKFEIGKWYKWYQKNHGKYHYGKVERINLETDTLVMSPWIIGCTDYGYSGYFDLSKAEQSQEISVEDVQEFLPKNHSDKISSDVFKKGEYIVITDNYSGGFCTNYIYKQRKDYEYLEAELDNNGSITNGFARYEKKNSHNWRYATQEEIDEYEKRSKPYDVTELQKKELSMEEIQEQCKKRFPIGCTYINTDGENIVLEDDPYTYTIANQNIWAHSGAGCLYQNGKWAELVSLPEENITEIPDYVECVSYFGNKYTGKIYNTKLDKPEKISTSTWYEILIDCGRLKDGSFKISNKEAYEQQKSLTYESVSGCFPTDKKMFIFDEVVQYPLTPSECWKNIPKFTEQDFDIYGPTPDIE